MSLKEKRARTRMLLGRWGGWTTMLERLRREQSAARAWARSLELEDAPEAERAAVRSLTEQLEMEMWQLIRLREVMTGRVAELDEPARRVLILRYEKGLSWVQVSLRMNYDESSVRRIETRAVDAIGESVEALPL